MLGVETNTGLGMYKTTWKSVLSWVYMVKKKTFVVPGLNHCTACYFTFQRAPLSRCNKTTNRYDNPRQNKCTHGAGSASSSLLLPLYLQFANADVWSPMMLMKVLSNVYVCVALLRSSASHSHCAAQMHTNMQVQCSMLYSFTGKG